MKCILNILMKHESSLAFALISFFIYFVVCMFVCNDEAYYQLAGKRNYVIHLVSSYQQGFPCMKCANSWNS